MFVYWCLGIPDIECVTHWEIFFKKQKENKKLSIKYHFPLLSVTFYSPHGIALLTSFIKDFIFSLFIYREREERERNINVWDIQLVASHTPPSGDPARNPSTCPDWELNQQPFRSHAGTHSPEPHQPEHIVLFNLFLFYWVIQGHLQWSEEGANKILENIFLVNLNENKN